MTMTLYDIFFEHLPEYAPLEWSSTRALVTDLAESYEQNADSMYAAIRRRMGRTPTLQELQEAIEDGQPEALSNDGDGPDAAPPTNSNLRQVDIRHHYNKADDVYVFWLPYSKGRGMAVPGEDVREAKRRYSRWEESGPEETINNVCEAFGWPREWFMQMKQELGWTHDQDPFTAEEHKAHIRGEQDLLKDLSMMNRSWLERQAKVKRWRRTERDAEKWRAWKAGKLDHLQEFFEQHSTGLPESVPKVDRDFSQDEGLVVIHPADIHLGKRPFLGPDAGLDHYMQAIMGSMERLCERSVDSHEAVLVLGNDLFHVDGMDESTTRGTAQSLGCEVHEMVGAAYSLSARLINMARRYFSAVTVVVVRSNHDDALSCGLYHHLDVVTQSIEGVELHTEQGPAYRQYLTYGHNLMAFGHGHGIKAGEWVDLIMAEARELVSDTVFTYVFTAHFHYAADKSISESDGEGAVHVFQAPSPTKVDRWHDLNGFVLARRMLACYTFSPEEGHLSRHFAPIELNL